MIRRIILLILFLVLFSARASADVCFPGTCGKAKTADIPDGSITSAKLSDLVCTNPISAFIDPTEAGATDDFVNLVDFSINTDETVVDLYLVPANSVIFGLQVLVDVLPSANDIWQITVMDDGVVTALTCDIADTATTCFNTTDSPAVAASSDLTVLVDSSTGAADPEAAAELIISFCLTPD